MILLDYPSNGSMKNGFIKINRAINLQKGEIEYIDIEFSDERIKSYVEKNPSVFAKIDKIRNKWN